jgi:transposase-like protein
VKAFLDRPIEGDWPYLWIDATYVKVRQAGRIVSVAVTIAVDVNSDGRREILGLDIGPSEAETFCVDDDVVLCLSPAEVMSLVICDPSKFRDRPIRFLRRRTRCRPPEVRCYLHVVGAADVQAACLRSERLARIRSKGPTCCSIAI